MKANIKATITRGGASIPKPLTYDYMPEGYPSKEDASYNITWDGNTDGRVSFDADPSENDAILFYKVSDRVPTEDDCIGATVILQDGSSMVLEETSVKSQGGSIIAASGLITICPADNTVINNVTIPEKGTYFVKGIDDDTVVFVSSFSKTGTAYTPMSYDFMPDGYPKVKTLFDIKLTGIETVKSSDESFVKVSDMILSQDDIVDAVVTDANGNETILDDVDYVADDGSFFGAYSVQIVIATKIMWVQTV